MRPNLVFISALKETVFLRKKTARFDKCRIFVRQMAVMAKAVKYAPVKNILPKVAEVLLPYPTEKKGVTVAEMSYKKLKKIADKVPFTQTEWAHILHLSERTLQRYAKNNGSFEGIYTDRIILVEELIRLGLETFVDRSAFYAWLKKEKTIMGQQLGFDALYTERGIQELIQQLNRVQYGIYA
ncbi:MAG: hypothetical protein RLZZ28_1068 [Bacteroidota bacterium]